MGNCRGPQAGQKGGNAALAGGCSQIWGSGPCSLCPHSKSRGAAALTALETGRGQPVRIWGFGIVAEDLGTVNAPFPWLSLCCPSVHTGNKVDVLGVPAVTTRAPGCCKQGLDSGPFSHHVHVWFTSRTLSVPRSFVFSKNS